MKPSWEDAPKWARYLAQDMNGAWFWYENKPWDGIFSWNQAVGKTEIAELPVHGAWREALEERPS